MPKTAAVLYAGLSATDFFDGKAARRDKNGPTKEGADDDQKTDKAASRKVEVAEVLTGRLGADQFLLREASNVFMNEVVRPEYEESGHNVKAAMSGKVATAGVNVAEILAMVTKDSLLVDILQEVATAGKWARVSLSQKAWRLNKIDDDKFKEVKEQMLQSA